MLHMVLDQLTMDNANQPHWSSLEDLGALSTFSNSALLDGGSCGQIIARSPNHSERSDSPEQNTPLEQSASKDHHITSLCMSESPSSSHGAQTRSNEIRQAQSPPYKQTNLAMLKHERTTVDEIQIPPTDPVFIAQLWSIVAGRMSAEPTSKSSLLYPPPSDLRAFFLALGVEREWDIVRDRYTIQFMDTILGDNIGIFHDAENLEEKFEGYRDNAPHDLLLDPSEHQRISAKIQQAASTNSTVEDFKVYAMESFFRPGLPSILKGPIRAVLPNLSAADAGGLQIPTPTGLLSKPPTRASSKPATTSGLMADGASPPESSGPSQVRFAPACVYYLQWNDIAPHRKVPVYRKNRVCPYLTVEFEEASDPNEPGFRKLSVFSAIVVYNQWKNSNKDGQECIQHWGICMTDRSWTIYLTKPRDGRGQWTGTKTWAVYCGEYGAADTKRLIGCINYIHHWGMNEHADACRSWYS